MDGFSVSVPTKARGGRIGFRVTLRVALLSAPLAAGLVLQGCEEAPEPRSTGGPRLTALADFPSGLVPWRRWADRDTANAEGAPILLFLYSKRSRWCRDLVSRCFEASNLAREIARGTFPVRVDVDRRPDLAARYGMGGWPTLAFLEPGDTLITGGTYFDPEDLTDMLRRVRIRFDYADRRNDLRTAKRRLAEHLRREARRSPRPALAPAPDLLDRLVDSVRVSLAHRVSVSPESLLLLVEAGGSGSVDANRAAARGRLAEFVAAIRAHPNSLYRAPLVADGRVRSDDASLALNAGVLGALSEAAIHLNDAALGQAADRLAGTLRQRLLLPGSGLFAAGLSYATVRPPEPAEADTLSGPPHLDRSVYAGWNALTASGLAACYRATKDTTWLAAAGQIVSAIEQDLYLPEEGVRRTPGTDEGGPYFLEDQALVARAALDVDIAMGDTIHQALARRLSELMLARFRTREGALCDRYPEPAAPHSPVVDRAVPSAASVAVQVFVRMWHITGDTRYRDAAHDALEALVGPNIDLASRMGALGRGLRAYLEAITSDQGT